MNASIREAVDLLKALAEGESVERGRIDAARERLESVVETRTQDERRRAELEARVAERTANLTALVEAMQDAVFVTQGDAIRYANPAMAAMLGRSVAEILAGDRWSFVHPDDHASMRVLRTSADALRRPSTAETRWVRADGATIVIRGFAAPITYDGAPAWLVVGRDMTEALANENALRLSEERHRLLFDGSPLPITLFDPATLRIVAVNDAAVRIYGWTKEELTSMTMGDLKPQADLLEMVESLRSRRWRGTEGPAWRGTKRHKTKDGTLLDVDITSHAVTVDGRNLVMAVGADVTERRRLEEQLRESQKMEAVGQLAGGIAHDFNNMLAVILADTEFALDRIGPSHAAADDVREIAFIATRAAALTRQLLTFSRRAPARPELVVLDEAVGEVEKMLRRTIGEDIRLEIDLAQREGPIAIDRRHLEQAVLNLVVNARDAIGGPGSIAIATRDVTLDAKAASALRLAPGPYAMLSVEDDGCGMDAATRARVFEPFFTTKGVGKGTGLGLSIVFAIATDCGAGIDVQSEPGRGTTFRLFFPRREGAPEPKPAPKRAAGPGAGETVLVVEDEAQVRTVVRRVLKARGYRVIEAGSAVDALALVAEKGDEVDLVLTDIVMPDKDGRTMAKEILATRPNLRVLYMSGYPEHRALEKAELGPDDVLIAKPFSNEDLAKAVRRALDVRSTRSSAAAPSP